MHTKEQLREIVVQCVLELSDLEVKPEEIVLSTDPIEELGLDSHDGVAVICILEDKLGTEFPPKFNPLVDDQRHKSRKISEIIEALNSLITQKEHSNK